MRLREGGVEGRWGQRRVGEGRRGGEGKGGRD